MLQNILQMINVSKVNLHFIITCFIENEMQIFYIKPWYFLHAKSFVCHKGRIFCCFYVNMSSNVNIMYYAIDIIYQVWFSTFTVQWSKKYITMFHGIKHTFTLYAYKMVIFFMKLLVFKKLIYIFFKYVIKLYQWKCIFF